MSKKAVGVINILTNFRQMTIMVLEMSQVWRDRFQTIL